MPLMVPKMSGTRLNFASKSSVAPVDCQTYLRRGIPLIPDLAEQRIPADLRVRVANLESFNTLVRQRQPVAAR